MKIARRGKGKFNNCITVREIYNKHYKKKYKKSKLLLDYKLFKRLVSDYNMLIRNFVIEESGTFKLPYGLGKLTIKKKKLNYDCMPINWKLTKEEGKIIRTVNLHTNQHVYKIFWDKKTSNVKNKPIYSFVPTREFKRELAYQINVQKSDYFK